MNEKNGVANTNETGKPSANNAVKAPSRRKFLGQVGAVLTGGAVLGKSVLASAQSTNTTFGDGIGVPGPRANPRVRRCFAIRLATANERSAVFPFLPTRPTATRSATAISAAPTARAFSRMASGW